MEKKLWETLFILVRCFRQDLGFAACESLKIFFESLKFILPSSEMRFLVMKFMASNPIEHSICSCLKHVKWTVALNNYVCQNTRQRPETFEGVCQKYDPAKINKTIWGNSIWYFIHYTALHQPRNIPRDTAFAYKQMITSLSFLLPCKMCRDHLKEHLQDFPIDRYLDTNEKLFEWTVELHNRVNTSLYKPIMSLRDARKLYI
jgi:hypothetical protein